MNVNDFVAKVYDVCVRDCPDPLVGRPVEYELRELVISRGRSGYVALYSLEEAQDAILILSIRHQREAGYWVQDEE